MRGIGREAVAIAAKRQKIVEKAYELFSSGNIESVSLQDVANGTEFGISMLYRYFENKQTLVVEAATWKWKQFYEENQKRRPSVNFEGMTAAEIFEFYLDSFLVLYREHRDLLRFNQFFNVYVQSEHVETETLKPYQNMIDRLKEQSDAADRFINVIRKYTYLNDLTAEVLNSLIDRIVVHHKEVGSDGKEYQQIEIYYRFIGRLDAAEKAKKIA